MTLLASAGDIALLRLGIRLTPVHDQLWRVARPDGDVLGYLERFDVNDGLRYRAKRLIARQRRFIVMGEFWSAEDAIECFRSS